MIEYLLTDEKDISLIDYNERKKLITEFSKLPNEFFSKLRHFQPQIGCLNACTICSKYAGKNMAYWNEKRIRNVIAALKYSTPAKKKPLIVWERSNHRNGVIFSYLDNDVGNYFYLNKFIKIANKELGVRTRISTVGYSRYNHKLNLMHKKIARDYKSLAGVRLSFTPYSVGWNDCQSKRFSKKDYEADITNFLKIYKPYYKKVGSGAREFCIELRYKPLINISPVHILTFDEHFVICSDKYLYISSKKNIQFENTFIADAKNHRLSLTNTGIKFNKIYVNKVLNNKSDIKNYLKKNFNNIEKNVTIYRVKNYDGYYYSINPQLEDTGGYGINIYPITKTREKSGYIVLERFFLNTLFEYKKSKGLTPKEPFKNAKWKDVYNVINSLEQLAASYEKESKIKANYIRNELLNMLKVYVNALRKAKYKPNTFFDKNFTIDTGIICNLGRAIKEFKGLVSIENEPLTLNHERNYGKYNSTMVIEDKSWRLSCDYNDQILIEKLDMSHTATSEGQTVFNKVIQLSSCDEKMNSKNINSNYLIPGQRKKKYGNKVL